MGNDTRKNLLWKGGRVQGKAGHRGGFPWLTSGLIAAGILHFMTAPGGICVKVCYPLHDDFGLPQLVMATLSGIFCHLDATHLWTNVFCLWLFGATIEPRLGPGKYLILILFGSVLSSLISLNILITQWGLFDASFKLLWHRPTGASGAIAGLMGFLALSRGDARRFVPAFRIKGACALRGCIGSSVLMGLFVVRDFADGAGMVHFGGHMAGFLGGAILALVYALLDDGRTGARGAAAQRHRRGLVRDPVRTAP